MVKAIFQAPLICMRKTLESKGSAKKSCSWSIVILSACWPTRRPHAYAIRAMLKFRFCKEAYRPGKPRAFRYKPDWKMNKVMLRRVFLGLTFIVAGAGKVLDPDHFSRAVENYRILPTELVVMTTHTLPWLEVLAGLCLAFGFLIDSAALATGALSLVFLLASAIALLRGLDIDCGCFQTPHPLTWLHPIANAGLLALSLRIYFAIPKETT